MVINNARHWPMAKTATSRKSDDDRRGPRRRDLQTGQAVFLIRTHRPQLHQLLGGSPRFVEAERRPAAKARIAALWSGNVSGAPAIHAMGEAYDVYAVTDASGGSRRRHRTWRPPSGAAGAQPITCSYGRATAARQARTEGLEQSLRTCSTMPALPAPYGVELANEHTARVVIALRCDHEVSWANDRNDSRHRSDRPAGGAVARACRAAVPSRGLTRKPEE